METYTIEATGQGGYEVRAARHGDDGGQIVMSFPTRQQAQEWIDGQTRIAMKTTNASDVA
jgi:hypothetical protein